MEFTPYAWPMVGLVAVVLLFVLISKIKPKVFKGKVLGQDIELLGDDQELTMQSIKAIRYIDRRISESQRDISVEQKLIARLFKPLFINLLKREGGGEDGDPVYQIVWREFLDTLHRVADQNHLLEVVKNGVIQTDYLGRKLKEIEVDYRVGPACPQWVQIDREVRQIVVDFIDRSSQISRTSHYRLVEELESMKGGYAGLPAVLVLIDEEIKIIKEKLS